MLTPQRGLKGDKMNKVIIMGRLTRDPEVRYSQGENAIAIAKYSVAVDRRNVRQDAEQTADFINVTAFGKGGEFAEKYLHRGTKVLVTGRLQTGSYTNKDGVKVYTTDVIAEDQEFAESKRSAEGNSSAPAENTGTLAGDGFMNVPEGLDEDLPFAKP